MKHRWIVWLLLAAAAGWLGAVLVMSYRTGVPAARVAGWSVNPPEAPSASHETRAARVAPPPRYVPQAIGAPVDGRPLISNLQAVDLDGDGLLDVVACDAQSHRVVWIRQNPRGVFTEQVIASEAPAPAHVQAVDFRGVGRLDLLVACMGVLPPNNDPIGSVVILEHKPDHTFEKHVVLSQVARVTDVRAADFDGDGKLDLAVAQFGYNAGETRWMKNLGDWRFESTILQRLPGAIHCPVADINGDGFPDIVTLVSQEYEEVFGFINDGKGNFTEKLIFGSSNSDYGSSGIELCDLNADGKIDVLYTNGDSMDYVPPRPRPWHGVQWLENKGDGKFEFHRIADFPGAYFVKPIRRDKDAPVDLVAVSLFARWDDPQAVSMMYLRNDGKMRFTATPLATTPTHLVTLDVGDFAGDGTPWLVTGGLHMFPPFDRMSRVTLWKPADTGDTGAKGATP